MAGRKKKEIPAKLTKKELLEKLRVEEEKLAGLIAQAKVIDPFWYWTPNDGVITEEARALLKRYLREEDIPSKTDSQLDRLLCASEIVGTSGGNRASKTDVETIDGCIKATGELPYSLNKYEKHFEYIIKRSREKVVKGRVSGVDNKQLHRVVIPMWQKYIPRAYLKNGDWDKSYSKEFDILTLYRSNKVCAMVEFLTNEQAVKSTQGSELDWAKFDEEPDRDKWKETLMRFGTSDKLDVSIAWTPTEGLTWATDLFHNGIIDNEKVDRSMSLFKLTPVTNPYINKDTLTKIMDEFVKVSSYDEMRMRLLGEAVSLSGLVYGGLFDYRTHVIKPFFDELPNQKKKDYLCITGLDPHAVTATAMVFALIDREHNVYIDRCYFRQADTEEIKKDFWEIIKDNNYRVGWAVADKSTDSSIIAFGGRNIFKELVSPSYQQRIDNSSAWVVKCKGIPALRPSVKIEGSIKAGIDIIKRRLKEKSLFVIDRPENRELIKSFKTLERDTYNNSDKYGEKDRIKEGRHHLHAAMRYILQFPLHYYEEVTYIPQPEMFDEVVCW